MLEKGMVGDLFYLKGKKEVQLRIHIIENAE